MLEAEIKPLAYQELTACQLARIEKLIEEYLARIVSSADGCEMAFDCFGDGILLAPEIAEKPDAATLRDAIRIAVASRERNGLLVSPSPNGRTIGSRCKSHQRRITADTYVKLEACLLTCINELETAADFDALHRIVKREVSNVDGAGEMMAYDVAFRIGLWRGEKYHPTRVYLHAHPAKTAKLLLHPNIKGSLSKKDFPDCFQKLSCSGIENFMCIYYSRIADVLRY